jgi:hypothetical protein
MMKIQIRLLLWCLLFAGSAAPRIGLGQALLYMQDTPCDIGQPGTSSCTQNGQTYQVWQSPDLWVRNTSIPGYTPTPYNSGYGPGGGGGQPPGQSFALAPFLMTAAAQGAQNNQSPTYSDPLKSTPNYVYVCVHNIGTAASSGTEVLHVYWSVAAAGLSWPLNFVDDIVTAPPPCSTQNNPTLNMLLYGREITKPRVNIAKASYTEVQNYLNAVQYIANNDSRVWDTSAPATAGSYNYWTLQEEVHFLVVNYATMTGSPCSPFNAAGQNTGIAPEPACIFSAHFSDGFPPWHREFLNRYELLLQESNPLVTLLYWDWTTDPATAWKSITPAGGTVSLYDQVTSVFGTFSGDIGLPWDNVAPGFCASGGSMPLVSPGCVDRYIATMPGFTSPEATAVDSSIIGQATYSEFAAWDEGRAVNVSGVPDTAHNYAHPFIGGTSGNMGFVAFAAEDPFFFLLHANVDNLWSEWQRGSVSSVDRYDPSTITQTITYNAGTSQQMTVMNPVAMAYANGGQVTQNVMSGAMAPWNGFEVNGSSGSAQNPPLPPFETGDYPGPSKKTANDDSVVFPPVYDMAQLTVPVLQPGYSVVIEIPWYPPDPNNYPTCLGSSGTLHACLLARLVTSAGLNEETSGNDLYHNVTMNPGIAQHNEEIMDPTGPLFGGSALVRNVFSNYDTVQLSLTLSASNAALLNKGQVILDLGNNLFNEWVNGGSVAQDFQPIGGTQLQLTGTNGTLSDISMAPNEVDSVQVELILNNGYPNPQGQVFTVDLTQYDQNAADQIVGGQAFTFDFTRLTLVPKGSVWLYEVTNQPGIDWNQVGYNDSGWSSGAALLGYGVGDETTVISSGPAGAPDTSTYFRYDFTLQDLDLYSNLWLQLEAYDGAVVYLNGVEIQRLRMPAGPITPTTLASSVVTGLAAQTYYGFDVSSYTYLLSYSNVLAVEVHQGEKDGTDLGFDGALLANLGSGNAGERNFPPQVAFITSTNGGFYLPGQTIELSVNAIDPIYSIEVVAYYGDGQLIGISSTPPYSVAWANPPIGVHHVSAMATDTVGVSGTGFTTLQVASNVPPSVTVTNPVSGQMFASNSVFSLAAAASETGGSIQRVDFYAVHHDIFVNSPVTLLGTATTPPYQIQVTGLAPTNNLLFAVATDAVGARAWSVPVHVVIFAPPSLTINYVAPNVIVNWIPTNSILQQASSVSGPWQTLTNATPPYQFIPTNSSIFFRAYSP